jgi:uncharacterized protein YbjT (DUF2867 family)
VPAVLVQPVAADGVAGVVDGIATRWPLNGTVELAGPEQFRLDELIRAVLSARGDPRQVVADPHAGYFGGELRNAHSFQARPRDSARRVF